MCRVVTVLKSYLQHSAQMESCFQSSSQRGMCKILLDYEIQSIRPPFVGQTMLNTDCQYSLCSTFSDVPAKRKHMHQYEPSVHGGIK